MSRLVLHDKNDPEYVSAYDYILGVNRVIRGTADGTILVQEENDSGRATFGWTVGRKYLLFLFYMPSEKAWVLDGCGNSGPLSRAKTALSEIAAIQASTGGGTIHGAVHSSEQSIPVVGLRVEVEGKQGRYATKTDNHGEFNIRVPVGDYRVHVAYKDVAFEKDLFSYEDPKKIRIEPGGCAQIQFTTGGKHSAN